MKTKYYYIHGLGSSKNSSKFLELKKQYHEIECLDWSIDDDMNQKMIEWSKSIFISSEIYDNICIIASSTGCNFAYQLRLRNPKIFLHLVLINPLLNINYLNDITIMSDNIKKYLINIDKLNHSLMLISIKDDVINHNKFLNNHSFIKNNNGIIIDKNSTHKFENLCEYYSEIDYLINSIYL